MLDILQLVLILISAVTFMCELHPSYTDHPFAVLIRGILIVGTMVLSYSINQLAGWSYLAQFALTSFSIFTLTYLVVDISKREIKESTIIF